MRRGFCASAVAAAWTALLGCEGPGAIGERAATEKEVAMFALLSPAFKPGGEIPKKHTGEGEDVSPALSWSGAPEGTKEFALIMEDPDAPSPSRPAAEPWVHWVVWGIPASAKGLPEGSAGGGTVGVNSWPKGSPERTRYAGPMPPRGSGRHRYFFRLYALSERISLQAGAGKKELLAAMEGRILGRAELFGTYERK